MTPTRWSRVKEIFGEAVELRASQREAYVRKAAGGTPEVEREVVRLLKLHDESDGESDEDAGRGGLIRSAAQLHAFFPGEVLAGRYTVRRFIAEGGMGEVYEAEDMQCGERVALKTLRSEIASQDHVVWLRREIQAARRISHPNVCRMFDLVQTSTADGRPAVFLTMELLEGETLSARLRREGPMSERQALPIVRQMVAALTAAHEAGIIHRDFKTGNVMIVPRGNAAPRVVVTDFGLARPEARESRSTHTIQSYSSSMAVGTPAYMAPEQISGERVTPATDVYALGVVLHELLTGELPFGDESPLKMALRKTREQPPSMKTLSPSLRKNWNRAVLRCLQPEAKNRYAKAREVLEDLEVRSSTVLMWRRFVRQKRTYLKNAAVAAAIGLVAWLGWWLWPAKPALEAERTWQAGVLALHMNEPILAASRLEDAMEKSRLPVIAHAQLAQAWFDAGFRHRAERELRVALRKPLQDDADRLFARAVEAQIAGKLEIAKHLLAQRGATQLADLAHLDESRWADVLQARPQYPPARLWSAVHFAKSGDEARAAREFLSAETNLGALGDSELVRVVSARRGMTNIAAGQMELARQDLPILEKLPLRPGMGYGTCERVIVVMGGVPDNFAMPADPVEHQSEELLALPGNLVHKNVRFDDWIQDASLLVSLPIPPLRYCSCEIETRIRRRDMIDSVDDKIVMRLRDEFALPNSSGLDLWLHDPRATERVLNRMLNVAAINQIVVTSKRAMPFIDLWVQDDTSVDYIKLTLVY